MNSLHRELFVIAAAGIGLLVALFFFLTDILSMPIALQATAQSLLLWSVLWHQAWRRRASNRADSESPMQFSLGWANRLTLVRGLLIAACGGFLLLPDQRGFVSWLPGLCYSIAAIGDRLDGYVARRFRNTTLLGSELDMVFDAVGLVVAPLLALSYDRIHPAYLLVSVAYYLFVWGLYWRRRHGKPVLPLRRSILRRTLAGMQMGFIAVVLWPPLQPLMTQIASVAFMLPLLAGFWFDWLIVSARMPSQSPQAEKYFLRIKAFSAQWIQPLFRVVLLTALASSDWQQPAPMPLAALLICVCILILLGVAGRASAIALLFLLNWYPGFDFSSVTGAAAVFAAIWILMLGTGRYTLWQRDGDWMNRQDGS
ncbi:MAG: CDP-alcohol phosphatidyltransferase family protein [Pseudomonadota bacterium]